MERRRLSSRLSRRPPLWFAGAAALVQLACARPLVLQGTVEAWDSPPPGAASFVLVDSNDLPAPMRLHAIAGARIRLSRQGAADVETTSGPDGAFTLAASARVFREWTVVVEASGCQSARTDTRQRFATSYPVSAVLVCSP